jgi:3-hydroxyisobutyrate dehydrogenase-like beta-hydroxyacid dehydrogenase
MSKLTLGFIGLGVMGEPMCRNILAKSGNKVRVFDLDAAPVQRLVALGAESAADVGALVRGCDVVLVSLPSGKVLLELAHAGGLLAHMQQGQIFIDLGTSAVRLTRELAAEFAARGVRYLDAPVARTRQAAEAGTLSIMVGGDAATFEEIRLILACCASDITHCGAIGSGQVTKILNNMVLFETVNALSEAYAIAHHAGFDPKSLFETLTKGSGDSFALRSHGLKAIIPQQFPLRAFSVEYAKKDLSYALELAEEHGLNVAGARCIDALFDQAIAKGLGDEYHPVVSRVVDRNI